MSDLGDDLEPKDKRNLTTMVHYIIGKRIHNYKELCLYVL